MVIVEMQIEEQYCLSTFLLSLCDNRYLSQTLYTCQNSPIWPTYILGTMEEVHCCVGVFQTVTSDIAYGRMALCCASDPVQLQYHLIHLIFLA